MNDCIEQTHVYEYLGKENDPLYNNILHLKLDQSLFIPETKMHVKKTKYGLYEIVSGECHECYSSPQTLYERVSHLLNDILLRRQ